MTNKNTIELIFDKLGITALDNILAEKILISSLRTILSNTKKNTISELIKENSIQLLDGLRTLSGEELEYLENKLVENKSLPSIEECQVLVQKTIPTQKRKFYASYFTVDIGTELMSKIAKRYYDNVLKKTDEKIVISDPYMGSARTLTKAIKSIGSDRIKKVIGIEPYLLSALCGYAALLAATKGQNEIEIVHGDTFSTISDSISANTLEDYKADIVLTNPPFTRWSNLPINNRNVLTKTINNLKYKNYISRKDTSLQIFSMFFVDLIVKNNGMVVSVLPASTFYTASSEGYKEFLRQNYEINAILENSDSSFSEDSGFKELILIASKTQSIQSENTIFEKLNPKNLDEIVESVFSVENSCIKTINLHHMSKIETIDRNWSFLLKDPEFRDLLLDIIEQGQKNKTFVRFSDIFGKNNLIRGIEMYGTDFFFVPNRHWSIIEDKSEYVILKNIIDGEILTIEKRFLEKVLRKPQNYSDKISVDTDAYTLSIPTHEKITDNLKKYIDYGVKLQTAEVAIRAKENTWSDKMGEWYSHINHQIKTKNPYGNVFLPDKLDSLFKNRGVFAIYTENKTIATKNFYELRIDDKSIQKIIALWFNSTIFLSFFLSTGKLISDRFIRMLGNDYLNGLILNVYNIDDIKKDRIVEFFDEIKDKKLPPLRQQLVDEKFLNIRKEMDYLILDAIGIENKEEILNGIYEWMKTKLTN